MKYICCIMLLSFLSSMVVGQVYEVRYYKPVKSGSSNEIKYKWSSLVFGPKSSMFKIHANDDISSYDEVNLTATLSLENAEMWFYKDIENKYLRALQQTVRGEKFIIRDSLHSMRWHISQESKEIGGLKVIRANTNFRGRKYEAWFCPQYPVPNGPWKLGGLPGLILEAFDSEKEVVFLFHSLSLMESQGTGPASPAQSSDTISVADFYDKCAHQMEEYLRFMEAKLRKMNPDFQFTAETFSPWEIIKD